MRRFNIQRCGTSTARAEVVVDGSSDHVFWWGWSQSFADDGGMFIATHQALQLGMTVLVTLYLDDAPEGFEVAGVIRWARGFADGSDSPPGFGIKFVGLRPETRAQIEHFARTVREPIFHDLEDAPMRRRRSQPSSIHPAAS